MSENAQSADQNRYDSNREKAAEARRQAHQLRELHKIANCGLDLRLNYGTRYVPRHIEMRVADQFPIWADEYEAVANQLEAENAAMFTKEKP